MAPEQFESIRRSFAMTPSLTRDQMALLIDECERLMRERADVARILANLGPAWTDTRKALNELHRIVGNG